MLQNITDYFEMIYIIVQHVIDTNAEKLLS
jgi:hypothetical protein